MFVVFLNKLIYCIILVVVPSLNRLEGNKIILLTAKQPNLPEQVFLWLVLLLLACRCHGRLPSGPAFGLAETAYRHFPAASTDQKITFINELLDSEPCPEIFDLFGGKCVLIPV